MNDLRNFLIKFLETINFSDSKDEFINKFLNEAYLQTLDSLIKTLPADKQALMNQHLESAKTPELLQKAVEQNFNKESFEKVFQQKTQEMFADYLKTIETALTDEQKTNLETYFSSFQA